MLEGSADDLHRLVLNLIENAYLHTPPGTPVVVSVRRDGQELRLEVADRGPGVPAEMRGRVFERFTREGGETAGRQRPRPVDRARRRRLARRHRGRSATPRAAARCSSLPCPPHRSVHPIRVLLNP